MKHKGSSQAHTGSNKSNKKSQRGLALAVLLVILAGCVFFMLSDASDIAELRNDFLQRIGFTQNGGEEPGGGEEDDFVTLDGKELPAFDGKNYVEINGGVPLLPAEVYAEAGLVNSNGKWKTEGTLRGVDSNKLNKYEHYGELDNQGRCTVPRMLGRCRPTSRTRRWGTGRRCPARS